MFITKGGDDMSEFEIALFVAALTGWLLVIGWARHAMRLRKDLIAEILAHRETKIRTGDFGAGYRIGAPRVSILDAEWLETLND